MKKMFLGVLIGFALSLSATAFAQPAKQYVLTLFEKPIYVNGQKYNPGSAPALSYQGTTYVPLKALSDVLGTKTVWNPALNRIEIGSAPSGTSPGAGGQNAAPTIEPIPDYHSPSGGTGPAVKLNGVLYLSMQAANYEGDLSFDPAAHTLSLNNYVVHYDTEGGMSEKSAAILYRNTTYIRQSDLDQAQKAYTALMSGYRSGGETTLDAFKKALPAPNKTLDTDGKTIYATTEYYSNRYNYLKSDVFTDWWNRLGGKREELLVAYARELQKENPNNTLVFTLRVWYTPPTDLVGVDNHDNTKQFTPASVTIKPGGTAENIALSDIDLTA